MSSWKKVASYSGRDIDGDITMYDDGGENWMFLHRTPRAMPTGGSAGPIGSTAPGYGGHGYDLRTVLVNKESLWDEGLSI